MCVCSHLVAEQLVLKKIKPGGLYQVRCLVGCPISADSAAGALTGQAAPSLCPLQVEGGGPGGGMID